MGHGGSLRVDGQRDGVLNIRVGARAKQWGGLFASLKRGRETPSPMFDKQGGDLIWKPRKLLRGGRRGSKANSKFEPSLNISGGNKSLISAWLLPSKPASKDSLPASQAVACTAGVKPDPDSTKNKVTVRLFSDIDGC